VAAGALPQAPLPGDVFRLNWPRLGLDGLVVRVTGIEAGELGAGRWRIDAVEDVFGLDHTVLSPEPPRVEEPIDPPLPPALVLALEVPYWELARRLSRADLATLTDTDTYVGALAAAGGPGQLNWQLATGPTPGTLAPVVGEDYAPVLAVDVALAATEAVAVEVPVSVVSQPQRLAEGDYAYLVDAAGELREAVAVLGFDPERSTVALARGVLDTTPQAHPAGTRLVGVGEWAAAEEAERAPGESVVVGAIPRTGRAVGEAALAANGQPLTLVGRPARPYAPGQVRLNGRTEPDVVAGDLVVTWAHRDRTQQTAYLVRQDEGDIGPEPGVTYTVRVLDRDGRVVHSAADLAGTGFMWSAAQAAQEAGAAGERITLELGAVRDGLASWQAQVRHVERAGYGLRWGRYWGGV
jgi:hypothetical protein